jgi:hypothetical protein
MFRSNFRDPDPRAQLYQPKRKRDRHEHKHDVNRRNDETPSQNSLLHSLLNAPINDIALLTNVSC